MIPPAGLVALTAPAGRREELERRWAGSGGPAEADLGWHGSALVVRWGLPEPVATGVQPLTLTARTREGYLHGGELGTVLDAGGVATLLPPFAVLRCLPDGDLSVQADSMGLRQLYQGEHEGVAGISTSAALLAACLGVRPDPEGVAVQGWLGWQLGQRTLWAGVQKLAPGVEARLGPAGLRLRPAAAHADGPIPLGEALEGAAALLRTSLARFLDERPEGVLQLTGGQDSRILLSAVEPARRRGLGAMTLGRPGDPDVEVARSLAARVGLEHEVHGLDGIEDLTPEQAWGRVARAAGQLDGMADPLATAALGWAEERFTPSPRLSGLGGEVARGFYYDASGRTRPVTSARSRRLAGWRLFVNEAVEREALTPEFASWSRSTAERAVHRELAASGLPWLQATDDLYLRNRMQRWAGVTETAWCLEREIVNPMLDPEFLDLVGRLDPRDKRGSVFLARLQMTLDDGLGRIPLDGRPPPAVYAQPGARTAGARVGSTGHKLVRKAVQKLRRAQRPPVGGEVLAARVLTHWRQNPQLLDESRKTGFLDERWVDDLVTKDVAATPSTVAFLTSLVVTSGHSRPS
ncbi:hypothetical protein ACFFOM_17170 [Microlunatus capsulatus]|uniref:Asparagine synthase (Glutamine-hydrolyzing) n=1 Tax=Microlunatus capsulatus TaxID=99117 RepID=A0ABS4ZCU4_9ACTN|nr:hypothetical protein [Microlunatus capsulatus]MBP2418557.1 asparagine synthase (glutamine-hydrolyzing) [Microlunatus capsulatus]